MTLQISQTKSKKYNLWNNSSAEQRILGCLWEPAGTPLSCEFIDTVTLPSSCHFSSDMLPC